MTRTSKFMTWAFLIAPMLDKLCIGNVSISQLLLVISLIISFFSKDLHYDIDKRSKKLFFILVVVLVHSLFSFIRFGNVTIIHKLVSVVFYFILLFVFQSRLSEDYFYRCYKKLALFVAFGIIIQSIQVYLLGQSVNPLTFFPDYIGHTAQDLDRPMSFFSEPSHYAEYILPLLIISLYKKDYFWAFLSLGSIFLSLSVLGIVSSLVILIFYVSTVNQTKHRIVVIIILGLVLVGAFSLGLSEIFEVRAERMVEGNDMSTFQRLWWGYELFSSLPTLDMFLGIGAGNQLSYFNFSEYELFYNSISGLLIEYGIIVTAIVLYSFFYSLTKGQSQRVKALQLCIATVCFSSTIYFTSFFFYFYSIYFVMSENRPSNIIEVHN